MYHTTIQKIKLFWQCLGHHTASYENFYCYTPMIIPSHNQQGCMVLCQTDRQTKTDILLYYYHIILLAYYYTYLNGENPNPNHNCLNPFSVLTLTIKKDFLHFYVLDHIHKFLSK